MSEMILAEQGGKSGNGPRYPILFYVRKGATECRVHGVPHRRTDRTLRDGTPVFEAIEPHAVETHVSGWRDRQGDVWTLGDDGLMHTPETAPFLREHVEKKWGPLVPEPHVVGREDES